MAKNYTFSDFDKNGSKDFSDFLYGVRGDDYLTFCENRMSKKNSGSRVMARKWPKTALMGHHY